jgi:hypothetical protein
VGRKIRVGRGAAMVELDDELSDAVRRTLDRMAPTLMDRLERDIDEVAMGAINEWPVKTGVSKRSFEWGVRLPDRNHIEGFIINTAERGGKPYAYLIKGKAQGGKPTFRELVERPFTARMDKLVDDLPDVLVRLLEGRT